MTSQTLISSSSSTATVERSQGDRAMVSNVAVLPSISIVERLPYSKTQQVELLHLQAEAEALLQQVQILKQQKHLSLDA